MKANLKSKLRTTLFWSGLGSAVLIAAQSIAAAFGYELPSEVMSNAMYAVNSLLALLSFGGVLVDTGKVQSFQAMRTKTKE